MRGTRSAGVLSASLAVAAGSFVSLGSPAVAASSERIAVAFDVVNLNRSALPCASDGATYTIRGHIVGPASMLQRDRLDATLYLHEFSFGAFFWSFPAAGYDFAADLARRGHVSVIVDRLGYDTSDHPAGRATCLGAQADIVAQIVRQLRSGRYRTIGGAAAWRFRRIVLAGHSVGGGVAELAAHSFPDLGIDGLALFAWADRGYSRRAVEQSLRQGGDCTSGGEPSEAGGPSGYAYYGRTENEFRANVFADTDPAVEAVATKLRNRDPCGDATSLAQIAVVNGARAGSIEVPVLLLFGDSDAIFNPGTAEAQAASFDASSQVTLRRFARAGHALALERAAPAVRTATTEWLTSLGMGARPQTYSDTRSRRPALPATGTPQGDMVAGCILFIAGLALRRIRPA